MTIVLVSMVPKELAHATQQLMDLNGVIHLMETNLKIHKLQLFQITTPVKITQNVLLTNTLKMPLPAIVMLLFLVTLVIVINGGLLNKVSFLHAMLTDSG